MAPSFGCFPGCNGSSKHPHSPENQAPRLAELPVLPEIPKTSPFKSKKKISKQELQRKKTAKMNGPASWSTASRLSRPEDMAEFRAIFEDSSFLGQENPQISPTATLPPMTTVSSVHPISTQTSNTPAEKGKPSIELLKLPPELENKKSSHSLANALRVKVSFSKIRKQLSRESARLSLHSRKKTSRSGTASGSSEEELERRAELRRIRKMRIQEELEREGFDSDAKSIGTLTTTGVSSSVKTRVAEMREQLKSSGGGSTDLVSFPDFNRGCGFEWTPSKLSTHAIFAISGRPSNVVVLPSTPFAPEVTSEIITDKPTIEGTGRMRRHSTPAQILPPLDIEVYTPTIPNGDSISAAELPPAPVLRPAKLPSIGDETARRTSWRLSYASDRRASHLRSLSGQEHRKSRSFSQGQLPPLPIGDESDSVRPNPLVYDLPTVAPLRHWLHSQGLRIPSEVIDDSSSENESRSPSAKKLGKRKVLSHEKLYTDQENFGGVDGSREHSPVLHLHEMGISQRLGSRGLVTSTSSPALSVCGSRFDGGHRRGISGVSSAAGSKYSRYSNFSPYSERSRYFTQKSNRGSKHSRSHSEIITPYSAHSRHQEQPKEDSSKSGQYSSDQTGISSVNIPDAWGSPMRDIDGSSSIYHTPMEAKSSPFQVPSRTSSARNSPQKGAKYKIDQILHTGTSQHSGRRSDGSDRVDLGENDGADLDMVLSDGKKSEDSDFPIRSSGVDSGDFTNIVAIPLNSSTSVNKPNMRWMGIRSTFDISPEQAEMQSFNEREFSLRRISRHPTNNDSSLLASETQSFLEREKELMGIKKRFTMPVGKGDPKEPVRSKFKEEFEKPSLSFHRSLSRPHTFFSKIRFSKKKSNSKIEHQSLDGASMVDPADGAGDLTPGTPTPGIYVSTPGVYERSNPFDDASKAAEGSTTTPGLQTPDPRGPPRGPRAGGTPGGKAPKAAPVMAPAMRPGIEPSKGQKKKAMREKLASWEDELAAVEKAAREKSKGVAQPKRRRHRDDWDPVKWSSFPSHDREERAESAGAADRVDKQDFAIKARTPSGNVLEWHHSDRKHHFQHHEQPEHVNLTTRDKISLKLRNTLFKIQSTEAAFENDAANGRRTSISAGGELEFPELEIVGGTESSGDLEKMEAEIEEALRIEEELKANERKRQEAAAKRALMRAPPPTTDGSLDGVVQTWAGGESEMERERLVDNSVQVADPHFYDDCVDAPVVERDGEWFDDNEDADESSSIHSARTTGSVQLEMERGTAKEKGMITCIGSLDSKGGNKEKFGTWNGRGARGQKKNNSSAQTVYGFKTKKVVVGRGASGVERNGSSQNEGILRMSTVDFQRDAERSERVEMERVLSAAKAAWGV